MDNFSQSHFSCSDCGDLIDVSHNPKNCLRCGNLLESYLPPKRDPIISHPAVALIIAGISAPLVPFSIGLFLTLFFGLLGEIFNLKGNAANGFGLGNVCAAAIAPLFFVTPVIVYNYLRSKAKN